MIIRTICSILLLDGLLYWMVWFIDNGRMIRFPVAAVIALLPGSISCGSCFEIEYRIGGLIGATVVPVAVGRVF